MEKQYRILVVAGDYDQAMGEFNRHICQGSDLAALNAVYGMLANCHMWGFPADLLPEESPTKEIADEQGLSFWLEMEEFNEDDDYVGTVATTNPNAVLANGYCYGKGYKG
jgi:hypothetical protein